MKFEHIYDIIDLKDSQVKAYIEVCLQQKKNDDRISIELIQTLATSYAQNLTQTFIENYREILCDEENKIRVRKYLASRGADKPHSGNRFSEELYKALPGIEFNKDGSEEKEKE